MRLLAAAMLRLLGCLLFFPLFFAVLVPAFLLSVAGFAALGVHYIAAGPDKAFSDRVTKPVIAAMDRLLAIPVWLFGVAGRVARRDTQA